MVPWARAVYDGRYKRAVAVTAAQSGKALALDTPLPTPTGWTTMGAVQVGDTLFDERGIPCKVIATSPVMEGHACFRVEFSDGTSIVADAEHLWAVCRSGAKYSHKVHIKTTAEIAANALKTASTGRQRTRWAVNIAGSLELPSADLPIKPYVLGVWLGDGSSNNAIVTCGDRDVQEMSALLRNEGVEIDAKRQHTAWRLLMDPAENIGASYSGREGRNEYGRLLYHHHKHGGPKPALLERRKTMRARLAALGVIDNKHIPVAYLRASKEQRLALLQGLMDTDGHCSKENGACEFTTISVALARGVIELARSLGFKPVMGVGRARVHGKDCGPKYRILFRAYAETPVFRLGRKAENQRSISDKRSRPTETRRRFIKAVIPIASVPVRCIGIDTPSHLYLAGEGMVPTHNTDSMLDIIGARLDQRPAPILYAGPTKDFLTDQFEPRLMALFDEADCLRDKVIRGRRMKKTLKWVAGVRVRLAHAGSSAALKSDPAALALVDEYDEMAKNIKGQGDALGLIEARGISYADFVTAITSTPSQGMVETIFDPKSGLEFWSDGDPDDIASPIWKLWQSGTKHHWAWPCLHCEEYFIPRLKHLRWPKNATPAMARRETFIACPHCGGVLTDKEHKREMNARGVYVAPGQTVDKHGTVHGDPPDSTTFSVWVSGLASPFVSWGQRAETYLTALVSGDPAQIQTVVNANFGELYSLSANGDMPEWQEIMQRRLPYKRGEVPEEVLRVVMGVDVQKLSLYYTIRGYGARGSSWLLDYGQLYGHTDDDQVWTDLSDLMLTPVGGLHVEKVFIDSGFRPNKPDAGDEHKVYEFARRYSWLVTPTKGKDVQNPPYRLSKIEVKPSGKKMVYSIGLAWLSTDFFKSLLVSRIRTPLDVPGGFYVPEDIDEDYCRQIVSEVRIVNRETGKPEWVRRARANHFLDCEALCAAAAYTLNVQRIPEGTELRQGSPTSDHPAQVPSQVEPPLAAAPPNRNLRSRFASLSTQFNR